MNICMVGYGAIAGRHMEALSRMEGVRPHVLVGRRPEPTAAFAAQWNFSRHTLDLESALADPDTDAVVITSPNQLHVSHAEQSLRAGKHVLLEIPMAMSYDDAARVAALARRVDRRLMVCHTMRYFPAIQEVQRRVAHGRFHIHHIVAFCGLPRRINTTVDGRPRSWTDDIHWHHGAHLVDVALWTTGCRDAHDIHCRFGPRRPSGDVLDMTLTMMLPGNVPVVIAQSYNFSRFRWQILFIGQEDTLEFDAGTLLGGDGRVVVPHHSLFDLLEQDTEFVAAVRENRDPAITGEAILPTMQVLQSAQACAENANTIERDL